MRNYVSSQKPSTPLSSPELTTRKPQLQAAGRTVACAAALRLRHASKTHQSTTRGHVHEYLAAAKCPWWCPRAKAADSPCSCKLASLQLAGSRRKAQTVADADMNSVCYLVLLVKSEHGVGAMLRGCGLALTACVRDARSGVTHRAWFMGDVDASRNPQTAIRKRRLPVVHAPGHPLASRNTQDASRKPSLCAWATRPQAASRKP